MKKAMELTGCKIKKATIEEALKALINWRLQEKGVAGKDLLKFAGCIQPDDLRLMSKAIDEDCEKNVF